MPIPHALLLQVAATPPPDRAPLSSASVARGCGQSPAKDGEIVVCGAPDDEQYRLRPIKRPPGMKAKPDGPGIAFNAAGGKINLYTSSEATTGAADKRVMIRFRLPF